MSGPQLGQRRDVDASVEPGDNLTRFDGRQRVEILRPQPLQKHGTAPRVRAEQPDGTVAAPPPQHEVLVFGVPRRES